jgi:hypothetical protein
VFIVKILGLGAPERYAVRRMVTLAFQELQRHAPQQEMTIIEITDAGQIGRVATVLVMPTLVINEKVACSGRFPSKDEILGWFTEAAGANKKPPED